MKLDRNAGVSLFHTLACLFLTLVVQLCSGQPNVASGGSFGTPPPPTGEKAMSEEDEQFWREVKAIFGGVLGFWGGVGSLGTVFLVIVLSQRYCCRKDDDKDDADG